MRLVLVFMCLLGLSLAASLEKTKKPQPCKSPPQLTGAYTYDSYDEGNYFIAQYEYDAPGQRIRLYEYGSYQNQTFIYDFLLLYKEGVMYQIDDKAQICVKQELKGDFPDLGVPAGASLVGQFVLGSSSGPGAGLVVNTWQVKTPDNYFLTVTDDACIPVSSVHRTPGGWLTVSFINNIEGIADPDALKPPSFCHGQNVQTEEEPVDFFTVIKNIRKNRR